MLSGCGGESSSNSTIGTAGSTARFTLQGDHLYILKESTNWEWGGSEIQVFNGSDAKAPYPWINFEVDPGAETLFSDSERLYIGDDNGVHIYSLQNLGTPEYISSSTHARACDPVVVEGNYMYVTLRDGFTCFNNINELQIVDISDPNYPVTVKKNSHAKSIWFSSFWRATVCV